MNGDFTAGVARRIITPSPTVELAGLGYYLQRTGESVRDDLTATALALASDPGGAAILIALDLMYNDEGFTREIRARIQWGTGVSEACICVNFSHSHNAPTAGLILGAGEQSPAYLKRVANLAAEAGIDAWNQRRAARLKFGTTNLEGMTFNRTRPDGPVDPRVSVLRVDGIAGEPLAVAVNFHSHCTAHMESDPRAISRDWPGELVDNLEQALPGAIALYLQGNCGDVNFLREYNGTARRFEPARALTRAALTARESARPLEGAGISGVLHRTTLPTRRWTREEICREREEGLYRQQSGDTSGWLEGVAKVCVGQPERLPLRYGGSVEKAVAAVSRFAVEWTSLILPSWESRPEVLNTEVQAIRVGNLWFAAHPSELFTTLGLELRRNWRSENLLLLGFSNGSIGYLPDAYDISRGSYAALQSPKFTGQFPFTPASGAAMVEGLLQALQKVRD
jgi:hypothetical protein